MTINPKLLKIMMGVGQPKEIKIMYTCKYFTIKELVSKLVYDFYKPKYGESFIWKFFDEDDLKDLDTIRETWGRGIIINNWATGGDLSQCGLRCNIDPLVKAKTTPYLGGHNLAKGWDLHDTKGENTKLYNHVIDLIKKGKLKKLRRVENIKSTPTWVHADSLRTANNELEIFNV